MLCARLNAEGIPAIIAHEFYIWLRWDLSTALGGVKVQVPSDRLEEAQSIERSCRTGGFKAMLASAFGDLDDVRCPNCGGKDLRKRRPFLRAAMAIVLSSIAGSVLPPAGWIYCCKDCDTEFRHALCTAKPGKWIGILLLSMCLMLLLSAVFFGLWLTLSTRAGLIVIVALLIVAARRAGSRLLDQDSEPEPGSPQSG